jgi:anti-anti-sigma factor
MQGPERTPLDSETPLREALRPAGPPRFGVSAQEEPDRLLVRVEGELDLLTAPKVAAELNGLIWTSTSDLHVDLREAQFIDWAGLQFLLLTRRRLLQASRSLTVICDAGPVLRVIELARLTETLHVVAE